MRSLVAFLTIAILGLGSTASAQADSKKDVSVGVSVGQKLGPSDDTKGHLNPGFLFRIGHGHDGWGLEYGLGWYSAVLQQSIGNVPTEFGELHVRPFMVGYGYSRKIAKTRLSAKLLGGYSFNSFKLRPTFDEAYRRFHEADGVATDVSNTFVLKPEVSAWTDIARRLAVNVSVGYVVARPEVTVRSSIGSDTRHIHADVTVLKVGLVYTVF
jgi:hypothetical protein